ncbi:MAG: carboxymuconolactone decarboxylase family protein [Candidatus Aminicenantes bacterium]|nr:carboxymuconolactone decarboxylase family protein [Candidatus Aminicenantes bacterium]
MMNLDLRTARLIAIGASVAVHCQTCLKMTVAKARLGKVKDKDIAAAVEVGKMVRRCAGSKLDAYAASLVVGEAFHAKRTAAPAASQGEKK